ncbi:MAG: cytochrome c biogenesis protein [Ignavibacteria bacterium]|nr:cytochrome c biogenesis protein [Ignavibacteria bacterium]
MIFFFITVFLTFIPYVGSNFATFKFVAKNIPNFVGPLYFQVKEIQTFDNSTPNQMHIYVTINNPHFPDVVDSLVVLGNSIPREFSGNSPIIANVSYDLKSQKFIYKSTVVIRPLLVLPYVPQLGEQIRIMNFHVPCAWVAVVAYLISMFFSIKFLKNKKFEFDEVASSSAFLGTIFAVLATVTGMIWAKFNWGSFWNWDPRQTSIFVLLLIYFAYFVLRQSIENFELKARLSSVYSIVAFITVPFLVFIMPRLFEGNHPGSANSPNIGPILSAQEGSLNPLQTFGFGFGFLSLTMLFFWLLNLRIRYTKINVSIKRRQND